MKSTLICTTVVVAYVYVALTHSIDLHCFDSSTYMLLKNPNNELPLSCVRR